MRIVAVDAVGSVTFGAPAGRRMIPGLGMSVRPPLLDESFVDEVVYVEEADTIRACHRLARRGFLFGGSTGTVVSGAMSWLAAHDGDDLTAVAIAPDFGERYLDTIYQTNWVQDLYGADVARLRRAGRRLARWPDSAPMRPRRHPRSRPSRRESQDRFKEFMWWQVQSTPVTAALPRPVTVPAGGARRAVPPELPVALRRRRPRSR